jgi:hypothetical protein
MNMNRLINPGGICMITMLEIMAINGLIKESDVEKIWGCLPNYSELTGNEVVAMVRKCLTETEVNP